MNPTEPLIKKGWTRVLVFCVLYFAVLLAGSFLILLLMMATNVAGNMQDALEQLNKQDSIMPILFIVLYNFVIGVLFVFLFRKFIDKKTVFSLGWDLKNHVSHALIGLCAAVAIIGIGTFILIAFKYLRFTGWIINGQDLFISLGIMVFVAVAEEMVFRGYILNNLMQSTSRYAALAISAAIFGIAHATNPNFSWIAFINIILAGFILGINYIYTQNLWYAVVFHFAWNFLQGPIVGYEVSGLNFQSVFQLEINGNEIITGGKFGFEGSIVASVLVIIATLVQAYVYEKKLKASALISSSS
ncbi:MAG: CPBP family intramembrane metalloprotease [Sphingobacteriales bacterium]|nr:CPBP family intramembrane metalloprotease [Sphingobacteriales bacterium]MBI3718733.1 CPBP family intramembrane metalloprotease [Sphingobacteriales bacterium]